MNGIVVAQVSSAGEHGAELVSVDYPLSNEVLAATKDRQHELRFIACEGSLADGTNTARLLRAQ